MKDGSHMFRMSSTEERVTALAEVVGSGSVTVTFALD